MNNILSIKNIKKYLRRTWIYSFRSSLAKYNPVTKQKHNKMVSFYSQFLNSGDLCFDIGANMGNRTEVFLQLGAKVIAVDPQRTCLKHLNNVFGSNENVVIVDKAVGNSEGYAELSVCDYAPTISTLSEKWKSNSRFTGDFEWNRQESVSVTTLNNLISLYGTPKFCKIDVEGFELPVIQGLTKTIPYLSFEINIELKEEIKACIYHLQSIGEFEFNCSMGESMEWLFTEWLTSDNFCHELELITNDTFWGDVYARNV